MNPIANFIDMHDLTMTATWAAENPNMEGSENINNYLCVIRRPRNRRLSVPFSMGLACKGEPTLRDVLDCLASDAADVEGVQSFEDWCAEYGYDIDSRKAERIYRTCRRQADKLRKFLGDAAYQELLWHTERE